MKPLICLVAACWAVGAHAEPLDDLKPLGCTKVSAVLMHAAGWRDAGRSPEATYMQLRGDPVTVRVSDLQLREMINQSFFDPTLSRIPAGRTNQVAYDACTHPTRHYAPLR